MATDSILQREQAPPPSRGYAHRLAGRVTVDGLGAGKRVEAVDRQNVTRVRATISSADGNWEMVGLPPEWADVSLLVIAFDDSGRYNAEAADFVKPVT